MSTQTLSSLHQSASRAQAGTWKLAPGRAMTLMPREPGRLTVAQGCLWATLDGPHAGPPNDQGDRLLGAGETLRLAPGQRLVIEPWGRQTPTHFSWAPAPRLARQPARWQAVAQPLADLRLALVFGGGALVRLVTGLARLALPLRPRAPRVACAAG